MFGDLLPRRGDDWGDGMFISNDQTYVAMPLTYQVTLRGSELIINGIVRRRTSSVTRKVRRSSGGTIMPCNR